MCSFCCFKVGTSDKVTLIPGTKENVISAWKLDDNNSETISEDDLLEADDLKKPDTSSLRGMHLYDIKITNYHFNFCYLNI
jgi:hypothetical protein